MLVLCELVSFATICLQEQMEDDKGPGEKDLDLPVDLFSDDDVEVSSQTIVFQVHL